MRNSTLDRWEEAGRPAGGERPGEDDIIAVFPDGTTVERYSDVHPMVGMTGELEALALYAGQGVGLISDSRPAGEIVTQLATDTAGALRSGFHLIWAG